MTAPLCDYPRAALRAQLLATRAAMEGRTDMDEHDQADIAACYGLPWAELGVELQGDFYSWWFEGVGKGMR